MKRIIKLSSHLSNQIAAGEVVTEPLSVVRELIDNSIDAGSKNITVEITGGGLKKIIVKDDGYGISPEDFDLLFERHATSKLQDQDDLHAISTLGFRGEALASISSVSKIRLSSRTKDTLQGIEIRKYGDQLLSKEHIARNVGTSIIVEDLFYNTPARHRFLKQKSVLERNVTHYISAIGVGHPDLRIQYFIDDTEIFTTTGSGDAREAIYTIYGKSTAEHLLPISYSHDQINIEGYVTSLDYHVPSRKDQLSFINGRLSENDALQEEIKKAYDHLLMPRRYPQVFLWVSCPYDQVDINIHPQKLQVKFREQQNVLDGFSDELRQSLYGRKSIPKLEEKKTQAPIISSSFTKEDLFKVPERFDEIDLYAIEKEKIEQKIEVIEQIKEEPAHFSVFLDQLNYIGTFMATYLLYQKEDSLYLMDQHAAHEKVLYERFMKEFREKTLHEQFLLTPLPISLSVNQMSLLKSAESKLQALGFDVETFSDRSVILRSIPHLFTQEQAKEFFLNFLEKEHSKESFQEEDIIMMSCKSAIKANHHLEPSEATMLLEQLKYLKDPMNCPHGRPIFIEISEKEIKKRFERITS